MIAFIFALILTPSKSAPISFVTDLNNFKSKSLSLETEKQNLQTTSDQLLSKKLFWTPNLSVSANQTENKINSDPTTRNNYWQADLSLNIFRGGSDLNTVFSASAANKAQMLQLQNENLRVEIKASDLIFQLLYLTESFRIQKQFVKLKEESYKIVKDRYAQGKLPSQEVVKSEVDFNQQKNRMRVAQLEINETISKINSLFVSEILTKDWPFDEKTVQQASNANSLPLIEQKYWTAQSREEAWRASRGLHWPSLDFQLQYQESDLKKRDNNQVTGILSLTLPLWNRLETSAQVSASYAQYVSAINDYKDTLQSIKQKSAFLNEKISVSKQNLIETKKNTQAARQLYQDVLRSFRVGRISTNDMFIEQNRLLENEITLAQNQLTYHQSLIESCAIAGLSVSDCLK